MGRVVVVGLGPADSSLVTAETQRLLASHEHRYLRTRRHPAADAVADAGSFDHHYERGDTFDEVYRAIVDDLAAAAVEHGEVLYAVPGSPAVLERTVRLLEHDDRVEVEVHPAMSFLDLAWARLGIDPVEAGVRLIDGHVFEVDAAGERGPLLVAHCHNQRVLSDIKLAVDDDGTTPVTVLQRLGLPDESVSEVVWADLDREVEADHLTALYIPELAAPVAAELQRFSELVATLRRECPWDREQTHQSLRRHLLEETYEVLAVLDHLDDGTAAMVDLEEELGDLLFQVVFHSAIAAEAGDFTLADVARGIHDKLRYRHPHVFGDVEVAGSDDVLRNWEQLKRAEKGRTSAFDGIAAAMPALPFATKILKKAAGIGLELPEAAPALRDAVDVLLEQPSDVALGRMLLAAVSVARHDGIDAEEALRSVAGRVHDRAAELETESGLAARLDELLEWPEG